MRELKQQSANWYKDIMKSIEIHKYSDIIDVTIDGDINAVYVYYTIDHDFGEMKDITIRFIKTPLSPGASFEKTISDDYKFLKQIDVYEQIMSVNASGFDSHTIKNSLEKTSYLIFIDENKQVDELRDEQLNNVLGEDI